MKKSRRYEKLRKVLKFRSLKKPSWALYGNDGLIVRSGFASKYEAKQWAENKGVDYSSVREIS